MNEIIAALAPHLVNLALTLFLGAGTWLATGAARFFGASSEQKAREALLGVVEVVAGQARERLQQHLLSVPVPPEPAARASFLTAIALPIVASSADYVAQQMPGKMAELGVDREGIKRMLSLRLGLNPVAPGESLGLARRIAGTAAPGARAPHE